METTFTELVIKSPFLLVKGFLMGFMQGRGESFPYFFHRKAGITRETLGEMLRELFAFDSHTHICLPDHVINEFELALKNVEPIIKATVESKKEIKGAEFSFSFNIYNKTQADVCKKLFSHISDGVKLHDFDPSEEINESFVGVNEYAPIHPYVYRGHGKAQGEFEGIMDFYLSAKRSDIADVLLCNHIRLSF